MLTDYPTEGQFQSLLGDWLNSKLDTENLLIKGNAIRDEIKARVAEKRAAEAKSKVAARSRHGVLKALGLYKEIPRTSEGNFLMETCALLFHGKDILCISDGENETEFFLPAEPTKLTPAVEEDTVRTGLVAWPRIVDHVITTYFPATTKAQRDALAYIFHGLSADNIRHFMRRASRYANSSCQAANLPHAYMIEVVFPTILNLVDETMREIYPVIQHVCLYVKDNARVARFIRHHKEDPVLIVDDTSVKPATPVKPPTPVKPAKHIRPAKDVTSRKAAVELSLIHI